MIDTCSIYIDYIRYMNNKSILKYVSDLHLERYKSISGFSKLWDFDKDNNCTCLALIGDIGNPENKNLELFFNNINDKYDKIFYIPGNHEYYCKSLSKREVDEKLREICSKNSNIVYLNNSTYELEDFKIIGTTLWSQIPLELSKYYHAAISDYRYIKNDDMQPISITDTNNWNEEAVQFLRNELNTNKYCIVLTHHAPLYSRGGRNTCDPRYIDSPFHHAFHNDLTDMIKNPCAIWLYGHTHYTNSFKLNNVIVATNQVGYEHEKIKYDFNKCIDLDELLLQLI
jgi:predicted phosphodiesterase